MCFLWQKEDCVTGVDEQGELWEMRLARPNPAEPSGCPKDFHFYLKNNQEALKVLWLGNDMILFAFWKTPSVENRLAWGQRGCGEAYEEAITNRRKKMEAWVGELWGRWGEFEWLQIEILPRTSKNQTDDALMVNTQVTYIFKKKKICHLKVMIILWSLSRYKLTWLNFTIEKKTKNGIIYI